MLPIILLLIANGFLLGAAVGRMKTALAFGAGFLFYLYSFMVMAMAAALATWGARKSQRAGQVKVPR